MSAQPSICHNTAEPVVCLLSLLYATIQPSLLCACSAFYMTQYNPAYYVPAQPSICHNTAAYCMPAQPSIFHNTAEPTVCLLSLLHAIIQPSLLCACSNFYMPQYNRAYCMPAQAAVCLLRLLYACSTCYMPSQPAAPRAERAWAQSPRVAPVPHAQRLHRVLGWLCCIKTQPSLFPLLVTIVLQYNARPNQPPVTNTISVLRHSPSCQALPIAIQSQTTAHILQYTTLYCNQPLLATIQKLYCNTILCLTSLLYCNTTHLSSLSRAMSRYNTLSHNTIWAVAHPNFYCIFFFVFFFFISSYWKITKNIYTYFFFSFSRILK